MTVIINNQLVLCMYFLIRCIFFPFGSIFTFNQGAVTGTEKTQIRDCQTDSFLGLYILNFYSSCEGHQKKNPGFETLLVWVESGVPQKYKFVQFSKESRVVTGGQDRCHQVTQS